MVQLRVLGNMGIVKDFLPMGNVGLLYDLLGSSCHAVSDLVGS